MVDIMLILLMEEILHQLIGSLSHYLQGYVHAGGCLGFLPTVSNMFIPSILALNIHSLQGVKTHPFGGCKDWALGARHLVPGWLQNCLRDFLTLPVTRCIFWSLKRKSKKSFSESSQLFCYPPLKINMSPQGPFQKERIVFQPIIFSGAFAVRFRGSTFKIPFNQESPFPGVYFQGLFLLVFGRVVLTKRS